MGHKTTNFLPNGAPYRLTTTTHSRVYYQHLRIKSNIPDTVLQNISELIVSIYEFKKSNIPGVTKKDTAKWQVLIWSGENIHKFLNIYRHFEAL